MRSLSVMVSVIFLLSCASAEKSASSLTKSPDNNIYAFVGRKITAIKDLPMETVLETVVENGVERQIERKVMTGMDMRMISTYEIIHPLNKALPIDTITFTAYDHWGFFNFANYEYALLLIGKSDGDYSLHKYQHDSVFKTVDGRWASCGESPIDTAQYDQPKVKAEDIEFSSEVRFGPHDPPPISRGFMNVIEEVEQYWNSPTFEIVGDHAICKKGIYVEDLYGLRMNSVMKARAK